MNKSCFRHLNQWSVWNATEMWKPVLVMNQVLSLQQQTQIGKRAVWQWVSWRRSSVVFLSHTGQTQSSETLVTSYKVWHFCLTWPPIKLRDCFQTASTSLQEILSAHTPPCVCLDSARWSSPCSSLQCWHCQGLFILLLLQVSPKAFHCPQTLRDEDISYIWYQHDNKKHEYFINNSLIFSFCPSSFWKSHLHSLMQS